MIFDLPTAVEFGGRSWDIATDYRDILRILTAFEDPDLEDVEKVMLCLYNLYVDFEDIPQDQLQAAYDAAMRFIDCGSESREDGPRTMDWTQDAELIFPAVNRAAGFEVRSVDYLHWWTFLSAYMEIGECTFAQIVHIRDAKNRGKALDKTDQEWYRKNRSIVDLKTNYTSAEKELFRKWGGG